MKVYTNTEFEFKIGVPRGDWEIEERIQTLGPSLYLVVFLFCPLLTRDGFTPNVNVLTEEIDSTLDIDTYTKATEKVSKQLSRSYRRHSMKRRKRDNMVFTELVYSAVEEGRHLKHKQKKCIYRGRAFVVKATDLKSNFHLLKNDFNEILDSFTLL